MGWPPKAQSRSGRQPAAYWQAYQSLSEKFEMTPNRPLELAGELLRVRDRHGVIRPLVANAAQRAFEKRRGQHNMVLKARQMGMTTWIAGRFFLRTALKPGSTTLMVAHTREASESIFAMVRRMWEELPEELRDGVLRLRTLNTSQIVFAETGSEFRVASAAEPNAGRGLSVQNLHCSEVSRWPGDARATLAGLRAALAPGGESVLESTPNGAYGAFYEEWMGAGEEPRDGACSGLVRHFLPWWMEPAYAGQAVAPEAMTEGEERLCAEHGLSPEQIGFRRGLERSYGTLRCQEFAEDADTCFRSTSSCWFEIGAVERRLLEVSEAAVQRRNGALQVWFRALAGRRYVLGVDTAGGGDGGDFAVVQVVDMETGMQCAELRERLRPAALSEVVAELAREYGDALVAVERNNHGAAVLALLEMRAEVRLYRQGGQAGWLTTAVSKPEMLTRLGKLIAEVPEQFASKRFLGECRTFVSDERGRLNAASGAHDDLVMAMAIAQAVRAEVAPGVVCTERFR